MASAVTGLSTFNQIEATDFSKVIIELTFGGTELNEVHEVQEDIKFNEQIVFAGQIEKIGKLKGADCVPNAATGVTLSEKSWTPVIEDFRLKHCSTDVNAQNKIVNQYSRINPDYYNAIEGSQSVIGNFLVASVTDALKRNIFEKAWFNDTAAALIADSGVFTAGTDLAFHNSFNGIFKQIIATTSLTTGGKYYFAITKNAGNSYANQALASGDALATFRAMYNKADSRLRGRTDAKFLVTRSLYDGLLNDMEDKEMNVGGFLSIVENGKQTLTYRGIQIVMMDFWDRFIDKNQNNGTKWNLPHRAVLTVPTNIPVGTTMSDDFERIEAFYDPVTKQNYIDGAYGIDAKLLEDYLTCVAY
jgi:hypothetical protein